jgi:hypothetical protein
VADWSETVQERDRGRSVLDWSETVQERGR